jgi:hypothetical protein
MFLDGRAETPAAVLSDQGKVINPGKKQRDAVIERERFPDIANTQSILFRSSFVVENVDTFLIPAYPDFRFRVDSGLMLDLNFEN